MKSIRYLTFTVLSILSIYIHIYMYTYFLIELNSLNPLLRPSLEPFSLPSFPKLNVNINIVILCRQISEHIYSRYPLDKQGKHQWCNKLVFFSRTQTNERLVVVQESIITSIFTVTRSFWQ